MNNVKRDDIMFYLYDYSDNLAKRPKKIYSPYSIKTLWRVKEEDTYNEPDFVEFSIWVYLLSVEKIWVAKYDEQKEWLSFYNKRWGILTKGKGKSEYLNWKKYRNDWIHIVKIEAIENKAAPKIETITETVNIQQIPLAIVETMNVTQLKQLAQSWGIELPTDLMEKWNAWDIKKIIVTLMTSNGNISE